MSTTQDDPRKCIKRLRARFERWELTHLRELAASLHERLEEAERRAEEAERYSAWAERRADIADPGTTPRSSISLGISTWP